MTSTLTAAFVVSVDVVDRNGSVGRIGVEDGRARDDERPGASLSSTLSADWSALLALS
jgi:hypothetical protein